MTKSNNIINPMVLDQACDWRVRLSELDLETSPEFERWLAADPAHRQKWQEVDAEWQMFDEHADDERLLALRREALEVADRARSDQRRSLSRPWWGIAAAIMLMIGATSLFVSGSHWPGDQVATYSTPENQRRTLALEDGSKLVMDASTKLVVRFTDKARRIDLLRGQAHFDVAKDASRPFSVYAGDRIVTAIGTSFGVDLLWTRVQVTMIEGRVKVAKRLDSNDPAPTGRPPAKPVELVAGEQFTADYRGHVVVEPANRERALAWQSGRLIFQNEPIADVIGRVGRYSHRSIVADPAIADTRISGAVDQGDVDGLVDLVTSYFPVEAIRAPNGDIELKMTDSK